MYIPGREDEGGGEELGLLLDGHIDGLDRLPGRAVPDHHPPAVAVTLPPPPVLHRLHRVRLPPALRVLLLSRVERYSTFWRFLKAGTMLPIKYIFMHPISSFSCRAGHATTMPRQRDHVFRPKNCLS